MEKNLNDQMPTQLSIKCFSMKFTIGFRKVISILERLRSGQTSKFRQKNLASDSAVRQNIYGKR